MNPKREKIFNAAVKKFSEKGTTGTTMKEISQEAGVGKGTLYRYFEDKEDLVSSLMSYGFERLTEVIKREIEGIESATDKIKKVVEVQLEFYKKHCDFCRFLTREFWGYKNKFEENIKEIRSDYTVVIEGIIEEGIEENEFKAKDPEVAAVSLIGMVNLTALHWFMFKGEVAVDKIREEVIDIFLSGMLN
ncbi:TetR/AcrR family transcriptional regulator [Halanaerobacter jeridensis]|uniref:AcrR family transcriptional regulator n=1 Tax=Halanaerobacter jeridensis TaxID=706427 RepID=A0A938XS63_9FIRM|nr:TetR/AcrR family transcriptional regulator [Halanaerobacter jeridensis]MBM7555281.1 AcrR family transcriptional regulator [Halanaerobacter jeridensis]